MEIRNYHTHTAFCDGLNSPREMVVSAIEKDMVSLGFSGHAHTKFDEAYCMSHGAALVYRNTVRGLAEEYSDKIEILCGLEYDIYSDELFKTDEGLPLWDYVIGSVHYVLVNGEYRPVDESVESIKETVRDFYSGDIYDFCKDYFETVAKVCDVTDCDIIGHFDLITKFNEDSLLFDEKDLRYIAAYKNALDKLIPYGKPFEINTGAMAKGLWTKPYPSRVILEEIFRRGGKIALSSDSHRKETVDFWLKEAAELAYEIGFRKYTVMSKDGPVELSLQGAYR